MKLEDSKAVTVLKNGNSVLTLRHRHCRRQEKGEGQKIK